MAGSTRKYVRGFAVVLAVTAAIASVVFVATLGMRIQRGLARATSTASAPRPEAWAQPHVIVGEAGYTGHVVFEDTRVGAVTELVRSTATPARWTFVGQRGAAEWAGSGGTVRFVPFSASAWEVQMLDGGEPSYLDRGGHGWSKGALMGGDGRVTWKYGGSSGLDDLAGGHLDDPRRFDFVAGLNGLDGVRRLDATGKVVWTKEDGNVWHVELVDVDGDGLDEIVHSNAAGLLTIRGRDGEVRARHHLPCYLSHFRLVRWPASDGPTHVVELDKNQLWIIGLDGAVKATLPFEVTRLADFAVASLPHGAGEPALAAVASVERWERTVLAVWDESGRLLHFEVLGDVRRSIASDPDHGPGAFLVGGVGKVWRYGRASPQQ